MNITLPIEYSDGHQYLLKLTDCKNLPIETNIDRRNPAYQTTLSLIGSYIISLFFFSIRKSFIFDDNDFSKFTFIFAYSEA